jgi:rhodanese-related sulfurtransferase
MENLLNGESLLKGRPIPILPREALKYLQEGAAILDIRPEYETNYRTFHFPYVYLLPDNSYLENYNEIPKDRPLIVVDNVGLESGRVVNFLFKKDILRLHIS